MATIYDFADLRIYKEAVWLDEQIWPLREETMEIDRSTWWQISRSVGSVADNIAEGFNRGSRGEYKTFVGYACGSAGEVRSQLMRMKRRGYLDTVLADKLIDRCKRLERSIRNTATGIRDSPSKGFRHEPTRANEVREPMTRWTSPEEDDLPEDELPF